jgi:hypothetical protein
MVAKDCILQAKSLQILKRCRRKKDRFAGFQVNGIASTVPFCELSPSPRLLNKRDVVFTAAFPLRIYFRIEEAAGFGAPGFKDPPLPTRSISFSEAASIRPICA